MSQKSESLFRKFTLNDLNILFGLVYVEKDMDKPQIKLFFPNKSDSEVF